MAEDTVVLGLTDDAHTLVENREWAKAIALLTAVHPADLADIVLSLDDEAQRELLDRLPTDIAAQLFAFAEDDDELRELIRGVGVADLPAVLEEAEDDVVADVIQQLEPGEQAETLRAMDRGDEVAELMQYEEESAGGLMTRGFVALGEDATVQEAIDYLRMVQPAADRAYYVYVLDGEDRLQGVVSIRDLIVSAPGTRLDEITQRDFHAVTTGTDQEEAARILQRYNLLALPVVDAEGHLEGVMGADDLIDVLEEEATEDMYRMVGVVEEGEKVFSPVRQSVRRRLPWMMVNLGTALLASLTVSLFDGTLAKATILAAFMPMVAGQGGNAGTQTATIAVRSMALGDLYVRDIFRAAKKETLVGIANGVAVGVAGGLIAFLWERNVALSLVLGSALLMNIVAATLGGVLIPLGLKSIKVDPALAANIFVTTITDIMGFLFFLGLASLAINQIA